MKKYFYTGLLLIKLGAAIAQKDTSQVPLILTVEQDILNLEVEGNKKALSYTASLEEEVHYQVPLSVHIITAEQIAASGVISIPEALRLAPNVIARQMQNGNYEVYIRNSPYTNSQSGLRDIQSNATLLLVNNIPMNNALDGEIQWESLGIGLHDIEKIEVVSGAAGMQYGQNASSGIIHIFTKEVDENNLQVMADVQGGTNESLIQMASLSFGIQDKLKVRLSGNYRTLKRFETDVYLLDENRQIAADSLLFFDATAEETNPFTERARNGYGINSTITYTMNEDIEVTLGTFFQDNDVQHISPDAGRFSSVQRSTQNSRVQLSAKAYQWEVEAAYQSGDQNLAEGYEGFQFDNEQVNASLGYTLILEQVPQLRIRPGLYYNRVSMDDSEIEGGGNRLFGERETLTNYGASTLLDLRLEEKIRVEAGIRIDQYFDDFSGSLVSYLLGGTYELNDQQLLRLSYANGYQRPFLYQVFADGTVPVGDDRQLTYTVNTSLEPQRSSTLEAGYRTRLAQRFFLDLTSFYHRIINATVPQTTISTITTNNSEVKVNQLGLTAHLEFNTVNINAGVWGTIQHTSLQDATAEDESELAPTFWGGGYVSYQFYNSRLNAYLDAYFLGGQQFVNRYADFQTNGQLTTNAKVSYRLWRNNTVYLNARNILNTKITAYPFGDTNQGLYLIGVNVEL
ncbi:MAG: TonB-dependent receptor plug domain-containing protein [Thermonemataceae bacterium]